VRETFKMLEMITCDGFSSSDSNQDFEWVQ
jgi:hypothetical protein